MIDQLAGVSCTIELYPFEGGPYTLTPGQIQSVSTSKAIRGNSVGSFTIQLAPGGPFGVESPVTWTELITPMSFVLIGMARGSDAAIPMIGVVTGVGETQVWRTDPRGGSSASRGITIQGADFGYFFSAFNWFALSFYGITAGSKLGGALDLQPASLTSRISDGRLGGNSAATSGPVVVGQAWYDIMVGDNGIMNKTYVPYQGSQVHFSKLIGQLWEAYPQVYIPMADFFMTSEESWLEKFQSIFPMPWYEFFVTTAPANGYPLIAGAGSSSVAGTSFSMTSLPAADPVSPLLVARLNPAPAFGVTGSTTVGNLDVSRWNALPLRDFTAAPFGFFQSSVSFSAASARNFYQLNPTGYSTINTSNSNNIPAPFLFIAAGDPASVQRYGFRPQILTTRWFFDPTGSAAQNAQISVQDTMQFLTGRGISWFHPAPLMASASVTLPLSPTILAGTRFKYAPFKAGEPWDFYIESVSHNFEFDGGAGATNTQLTLSRGLPSAIYADSGADGLLQAIHIGNAMRQGGVYKKGLPAGSSVALQIVNTPEQATELSGKLSSVFVTPQAGAG